MEDSVTDKEKGYTLSKVYDFVKFQGTIDKKIHHDKEYEPHGGYTYFRAFLNKFFASLGILEDWEQVVAEGKFDENDKYVIYDISEKFYYRRGKNVNEKFMTEDPRLLIETLYGVLKMFERHLTDKKRIYDIDEIIGDRMQEIWAEDYKLGSFARQSIDKLVDDVNSDYTKHINKVDKFIWVIEFKAAIADFVDKWEMIYKEMGHIAADEAAFLLNIAPRGRRKPKKYHGVFLKERELRNNAVYNAAKNALKEKEQEAKKLYVTGRANFDSLWERRLSMSPDEIKKIMQEQTSAELAVRKEIERLQNDIKLIEDKAEEEYQNGEYDLVLRQDAMSAILEEHIPSIELFEMAKNLVDENW